MSTPAPPTPTPGTPGTPPPGTPPPAPPGTGEATNGEMVPRSALNRVAQERDRLQQQMAEREAEDQRRREAELTAVQRAEAERDRERQRREQLEQQVTRAERVARFERAARAAGVREDALDLASAAVDLDSLADDAAAQTAAQQLVQARPYLRAAEPPAGPQRMGSTVAGQGGSAPTPRQPTPDMATAEGRHEARAGIGSWLMANVVGRAPAGGEEGGS